MGVDLPFIGRIGLQGLILAWQPLRPVWTLVKDPVADVAVLELGAREACRLTWLLSDRRRGNAAA